MASPVYYNDNLLLLNNFVTKNFGSVLNADPNYNIFSYLNKPINQQNSPAADFSTNITEDNIMLYIILNDYYLNTNTGNYTNFIQKILKTDLYIYNLNDFSLINYNTTFYDIDFNITSDPNNLYDIDLSYYANPTIYKYYFLLDILYQLYVKISQINSIDKSYVIDFLKKPITFKSRYYMNDNNTWNFIPAVYNITITNFYEIKNSTNLNITTSVPDRYTQTNIISMFSTIRTSLIKHLNFIENLDIIQSSNIALFYKICRLMLNNTIVAALNYLLYLNTNLYNTLIADDIPTNDIILYNNLIPISNLNTYNNFFKITKSSIKYMLFNDNSTNIYSTLPLSQIRTDITLFNTIPDYSDQIVNNNNRFIYIPYISIPAADGSEIITLIKKPKIYNFKYINNLTINLTFENNSYYINSISGVRPNCRYIIKLHNFTTIKPINIFNLSSTPSSIVRDDGNIFIWDNLNKVLIFTVPSTISNSTYNVFSVFADKIYMFNYINNVSDSSIKQLSLPILIANSAINNYGILLNTNANFDIQNAGNTSLIRTFSNTSDYLANFVSYIYKPSSGFIYSINNNCYRNNLSSTNKVVGTYIDNYTYINVTPSAGNNIISSVKALEITYYNYDLDNNFKDIISNSLSQTYTKQTNINTNLLYKIKLSEDGQTAMIYPTTYEKYDTNIKQYNTLINYCISNIEKKIDNNVDNLLESTNKDSDNILINMDKIESNNKNIIKENSKMKQNYSYYDSTDQKIVYTKTIELITIVIFTIAIIINIYTIIINDARYFIIITIIFILLLTNLFYVNVKLRSEYIEYFDLTDDNILTGHPNYKTREYFNNLFKKLIINMKNVKINTTNKIIKPKMKKELSKNNNNKNKVNIYDNGVKNDVNVIRLIYKQKLAQLSLLLFIGIVFTFLTFIYLLIPNFRYYIIIFGIIISSIAIYIYYYFIMNNTRTDARKSYWMKPSKETTNSLY